ncbi:hypothetical protein BV20DRAFT_539121 [Pilatotrama ljubarskyi]|nr:hypothetical protein BV20DRAFT_539121 [Pilatotrama ljubarskyi]
MTYRCIILCSSSTSSAPSRSAVPHAAAIHHTTLSILSSPSAPLVVLLLSPYIAISTPLPCPRAFFLTCRVFYRLTWARTHSFRLMTGVTSKHSGIHSGGCYGLVSVQGCLHSQSRPGALP